MHDGKFRHIIRRIMTDPNHDLVTQIKETLAERRVTPTAFGRQIANDSNLLTNLEKGRELRRELTARLNLFLAGEPLPPWTPKRKKSKKRKRVMQ